MLCGVSKSNHHPDHLETIEAPHSIRTTNDEKPDPLLVLDVVDDNRPEFLACNSRSGDPSEQQRQ
jgi:hypothetical protein